MAAFDTPVLDRPDSAIRRAMQKREDGVRLTRKEEQRLANRASVEQQTERDGGLVQQSITPRRLTPYQQGQKDTNDDGAYAAGREGRSDPAASPVQRASGRTASEQTSAMRAGGAGIDVRGYVGSMWAPQNSPFGARAIPPGAPKVGEPGGGIQVRNYVGSMFAPGAEPPPLGTADGYMSRRIGAGPSDAGGTVGHTEPASDTAAAIPSREGTADALLRRRFGAPPNERGQIDIADSRGSRSVNVRRIR